MIIFIHEQWNVIKFLYRNDPNFPLEYLNRSHFIHLTRCYQVELRG